MVTDDELLAIIEQQQEIIHDLEEELCELRSILGMVSWTPPPSVSRPVPQRYASLVGRDLSANQTGKAQADHPETAKAAAVSTFPRSGSARRRVFEAIAFSGVFGLTDEELENALEMKPNTLRPRRVELAEGGWVEDSGRRRTTAQDAEAIVWVATEKGRARLG